jgi:hypothetical protein
VWRSYLSAVGFLLINGKAQVGHAPPPTKVILNVFIFAPAIEETEGRKLNKIVRKTSPVARYLKEMWWIYFVRVLIT